ncbi:MAG: acyl carrier protein [Proteobacteria bacterium]|nr:acyl carrier protein [Pseudomonadota bacterium]
MIDEKEILKKVQESIVEALGVDEEEVTPGAVLFDDLGAESLDLLDIVFRLEKIFGIKIPRGGIQQDLDGALTARGAEELKKRMPEVDGERIVEGFRIDDIPVLFTVQTFVNIVKRSLAEKETAH